MLTMAVLAFGLSVLWTAFVVFANGMSDAPTAPLKGGSTLLVCWLATAGLFLYAVPIGIGKSQ
jgi:hypothetical protein